MSGKGLEGVVALESSISSIIDGVLTYRGFNIDDLADHSNFEEIAFLLWYGRLPKQDELDQLKQELDRYSAIPDELLVQMKTYPIDAHPMAVLRTAVSSLGMFDPEANVRDDDANLRKSIKLTAQIPTIITSFSRIRKGLEPVKPKPGLGFAANFLYMLNGEQPSDVAIRAFDKALILHADHELNASTFAARVTTGTLSDMYSSITTAISTLKGPLHGGANERVMSMLKEIGSMEQIHPFIQRKLDNKEKIMGFGHRVYKDGDPRAKHLREMSRRLGEQTGQSLWYHMSTEIEKQVTDQKGIRPNVDFYSASVYTYLGLNEDLFTPIFAMSRVTGWTAHVMEQYRDNRLIRPRARYMGKDSQTYVAMENR